MTVPLSRPADTEPLATVHRNSRQHGNSIQTGIHNFGTPALNAVVTQAVTFDVPFKSAPAVVVGLGAGVGSTNNQMVWCTGVSLTGFTLAGKSSGSTAGALVAHWIAIGGGDPDTAGA